MENEDQKVVGDLPACIYCKSKPALWTEEGIFAIMCPNDSCPGHAMHGDTYPCDTIEGARSEWIDTHLLPCLRCGGKVRIVKTPPDAPGKQAQKFIHCDGCAWGFSPAIILPDAELAIKWNDR